MSIDLNQVLKRGALNKWGLFWLVSGPISAAMIVAMTVSGLYSGAGVSSMIQFSVRCAVPWLYIAFAASSIQVLFPGHFSRWLLRNRKYFGMCFAAAMAWQGVFILWMVIVHTDYYMSEVYVLRDAIEGVIGYAFLLAMTVTSFPKGRKFLNAKQWRILHLCGIYFLWAYAFSVYWWALFYYSNPVPLDYIFYAAGLAAWLLRTAAWSSKRAKAAARQSLDTTAHPLARTVGVVLIGIGLVAAGIGSALRGMADQYLYGYRLTEIPELYLPYWPFEPFLALAVIGMGVWLLRSSGPAPGKRTVPASGADGVLGT